MITFADPQQLGTFEAQLGHLSLPAYGDPGRALYDAFGFARGSIARVWLDPRVWRRYLALLARGRRPPRAVPRQDTLQLGGDVLLDADGVVRWVYRSRGPADRPSLREIARRADATFGAGSA